MPRAKRSVKPQVSVIILAFRYGWAVTGISGHKLLSFLLKPSKVSALTPSQERALYLPVNEDGMMREEWVERSSRKDALPYSVSAPRENFPLPGKPFSG